MRDLFLPAGTAAAGGDPLVITPESAGWTYAGLRVIHLAAGGSRAIGMDGVEGAVVPLEGGCSVTGGGIDASLTGRASVFDGVPDVAFVPLDTEVTVTSETGGRFAIATSVAEERRDPFVLEADAISIDVRGAGQATRVINGLLSADVDGPQRLIVVEVVTPAGNWSSYPPHKHDEWSEHEVPIEEVYYFEIGGEDGFGFHRTYTPDGEIDATVTVRDRDVFLVPRGYHGPCVAAPGYDMYYLNVMAGPDPERRWMICNDPAHGWVIDEWTGMEPDPRALERQR